MKTNWILFIFLTHSFTLLAGVSSPTNLCPDLFKESELKSLKEIKEKNIKLLESKITNKGLFSSFQAPIGASETIHSIYRAVTLGLYYDPKLTDQYFLRNHISAALNPNIFEQVPSIPLDMSSNRSLNKNEKEKKGIMDFLSSFWESPQTTEETLAPFSSNQFLKALEYAQKNPLNQLTIETLNHLHNIFAERENDSSTSLSFRNNSEMGRMQEKDQAISELQRKAIDENPYLKFRVSNRPIEEKKGLKTYTGDILYIDLENILNEPETMNRLKSINADFAAEIERNKDNSSYINDRNNIQRLVTSLVQERLTTFNPKFQELLKDPSANKFKIIQLVAELNLDLISIHPYEDLNGRLCRFIMNSLLDTAGIKPSYILNYDIDLLVSRKKWIHTVQKGIQYTENIAADFEFRMKNDLPLTNSVYLIAPNFPKYSKGDEFVNYNMGSQFSAYLVAKSQLDSHFIDDLVNNDAVPYDERMKKLYADFALKIQKKYNPRDGGYQVQSLAFVTPDFLDSLNKLIHPDSKTLPNLIKLFYNSNSVIHRGIPLSYKLDRNDIKGAFKNKVTLLLASNRIFHLDAINGEPLQEEIIKRMVEEFLEYNRGIVDGSVANVLSAHQAGDIDRENYLNSYFASFSLSPTIAFSFAIGNSSNGDFFQGVLYSVLEPLNGAVNLSNMSAASEKNDLGFSQDFNPEVEISTVGAIPPGPIVMLKVLDGNLNSIYYVRDPHDSLKLFVLKAKPEFEESYRTTTPDYLSDFGDFKTFEKFDLIEIVDLNK